jgi:D-glycero-alpha-D-manno-heptose 1-phosphate guanylyltransferase
MKISEAIILAGGLGTRLRSVVADLPKCMAPVDGKPFLAFVIAYLRREGINRFIFSLGYKSEVITTWLDNEYPYLEKIYVIEETPLGTGGGIKLACKKVNGENVIVVNGDTIFNISISHLMDLHINKNAECTLALKPLTNFSRYGTVEINRQLAITKFNEKQYCESGLINGGIYAVNTQALLNKNLADSFSFEKDYLEKYIAQQKFYGFESDGYFIDIGVPEDYLKFKEYYHFVLLKKDSNTTDETGTFLEFIGSILELLLIE